jgi:two-component system response regulator DegU
MINILIADDHTLLAESLCMVLSKEEDMKVVGTVSVGKAAYDKCRELNPDIVLMDVRMPKMNGIEAAGLIKESCPNTKIAILTSLESGASMLDTIKVGADGYILKDTPPDKLKVIIRCICWGYFIASNIAMYMLQGELNVNIISNEKKEYDLLNDEDIEIIRLISNGKSNIEIASLLNFAEGTIRNKIAKIIHDLGVESRVQLVMFALKNNLL